MENFVVSARKYRPSTFNLVVGQEMITGTLKNAIRNNQLAQAFLFCGPRGVGKTTCARILAKTINCTRPTADFEACNECESCITFNQSSSFNVHELDAASNNGVDDIRQLVEQVRIPPQMGKYKVYIIDEVHMLSQQAFNAFLKTLEEPPSYAKFILATTEKHKIIPTILSRCQIFDFKRITVDDIARHLAWVASQEGVEADAEALHHIAHKADGALRDALSVFDQMVNLGNGHISRQLVVENLNILDYDYYFRVTEYIATADFRQALLLFNEVIGKGFEGQHFITGLSEHLRNLLMGADAATMVLVENSQSVRNRYAMQSRQIPVKLLVDALDILNKLDVDYRNSNQKRLSVEVALIRMCRLGTLQGRTVTTPPPVQPAPANNAQASGAPANPAAQTVPEPPAVSQNTAEPSAQYAVKQPEPALSAEPAKEEKHIPVKEGPATAEQPVPVQSHHISRTSIRDITLSGLKPKPTTGDVPAHRNQAVVETEMQMAVVEYAEMRKPESTLLYSALTDIAPVLRDDITIGFAVRNPVLEKELRDQRTHLLSFLKDKLMNDDLLIEVTLDETPLEGKKYMSDADKFREMVNQNPNLQKLTDQLGLEPDIL